MKTFRHLIVVLFFVSACDEQPNDRVAETQNDLVWRQDSIEKERVAEELRVKQKLMEEKKEQRVNLATDLVERFTSSIMNRVSEMSGENGQYNIINTDYDYDTQKVALTFISNWMAFPTSLFDDKKENHEIKAVVTLYNDGTYQYKVLEMNDVLKKAIDATIGQEKLSEWLDEASKENN